MILTYRILINLLYPLLVIFTYIRKFLNKEDPIRFKEKLFISHFNVKRKINSQLIWFHAASIGEFKSIVPIIKELNINDNIEFLVTTVTLSSSNLATKEFKNSKNIHHRFLPFDIDFLINKFLLLWKPNIIFLVDSEIWPNLIIKANKNKIPLSLINARITTKTFNRWMLFPKTAKKIFSLFDLCFASNLETQVNLKKLDVKNVCFNGNIKLINEIDKNIITNPNEDFLLKKRFWFAASTHKGEDIFCLQTHINLKKNYPKILTIIAPRHIERTKYINSLCKELNLKAQILNAQDSILNDSEIIIINSFGVLNNYFKYAKSVFIGKSILKKFENVGGQNPIDAAKLDCKIYHGPYVYNFTEIYKILENLNISKKIVDSSELSKYLMEDLKNYSKEDNKFSNLINNLGQKTLTDTMKNINKFLLNEIK